MEQYPWHAKNRFSGIRRSVGSLGPPVRLQSSITHHLPNSCRLYKTEILPIQRKTQTINQSIVNLCVENILPG